MITLIVATDLDFGIGVDNALPWHVPLDLAHFKEVTLGKKVVMGSNTFESLPEAVRPLPHRENFVVSRNTKYDNIEGVTRLTAISEVLALAQDDEVLIIGGQQLYSVLMPYADVILRTKIYWQYKCDAFMPDFTRQFALESVVQRVCHVSSKRLDFETWVRVD